MADPVTFDRLPRQAERALRTFDNGAGLYGFDTGVTQPIGNNMVLAIGRNNSLGVDQDPETRDWSFGANVIHVNPRTFEVTLVSKVDLTDGAVRPGGYGRTWVDTTRQHISFCQTRTGLADAEGGQAPNTGIWGSLTWDDAGNIAVIGSGNWSTTNAQGEDSFSDMMFALDGDGPGCTVLWAYDQNPSRGRYQTLGINLDSGAHGEWSDPVPLCEVMGFEEDYTYPNWTYAEWRGRHLEVNRMRAWMRASDEAGGHWEEHHAILRGGEVTWTRDDSGNPRDGVVITNSNDMARSVVHNGRAWSDFITPVLGEPERYFGYYSANGLFTTAPSPLEGQGGSLVQTEWLPWVPQFDLTTGFLADGGVEVSYYPEDSYEEPPIVEIAPDLATVETVFPITTPVNNAEHAARTRVDDDGWIRVSAFTNSFTPEPVLLVFGLEQPSQRCLLELGSRVLAVPTAQGHDYVVFCQCCGEHVTLGERVLAIPLAHGQDYAVATGYGADPPATGQRVLAVPSANGNDYIALT